MGVFIFIFMKGDNKMKNAYLTVGELIEILKEYPEDAKILTSTMLYRGALRTDIHKIELMETPAWGKFIFISNK